VKTTDPRTGMQRLDREECLVLLADEEVGRVAVIDGGVPMIFPVNYRLDGESIVFRTAEGTKLDQGPRALASFEVDCFDRTARAGWSVVVVGRLEEVTRYDSRTLARIEELRVDPWAAGEKAHWMRLVGTRISGRRVGQLP
jgi:nitroimidazol reductase NimA-like FMN-containing flavoprotein (pyridoxamine 5'-phosphate oxidase superfamily)